MSRRHLVLVPLAVALFTACGSSSSGDPATGTTATGAGGGSAGTSSAAGGTSSAAGGTSSAGGASSAGGTSSAAGGTSSAGGSDAAGGSGAAGAPDDLAHTFTLDTFTVDPGGEVYRCQNFANPFGADVEIQKFESHMAPGSHHLLFFYKDGATDGPLETCSGLEFTATPYGTQQPDDAIEYPAGVAALIKAKSGFRIQSHYLNTTASPITASVKVTLHQAKPGSVTAHAGELFMPNLNIMVAPHTTQVVTKTCKVPLDMNVMFAASHMHQHGKHFTGSIAGTEVYATNTWDAPKPALFSPEFVAKKGDAVTFSCTFQNDGDTTLTFGESALTNEMCIFTAQFYPLPDGMKPTIDCQ